MMTQKTIQSKKTRSRLASSDDSRLCPICLSGIGESATPLKSSTKQIVARLSACQHTFCQECILEWSKQTNTCPIDRIKFNLIELWDAPNGRKIDKIKIEDVDISKLFPVEDLTYCEICGSSDREDVLLLCDYCNKGYHTDCLRPRIEEIPLDLWYCRDCAHRIGRAHRWREPQYYYSSQEQEQVSVDPRLPQFTEITQAASDNSSGFDGTGHPRRRRKRYIAPSSPSDSSGRDSEPETQVLAGPSRPNRRLPVRRNRKRRRIRRYIYKHSRHISEDSDSSNVASSICRPKRLCRMNSQKAITRPASTYQTRNCTRKLLRNNSVATSPSSSTNPDVIHMRHPLSTQTVFPKSDSDSESSSTSSILLKKEESSSCEEPATIAETEPSDNNDASDKDISDNEALDKDVSGNDASDNYASDNNGTLFVTADILAGPIDPPPNHAPCSSHSDTTSSRYLRPRRQSSNIRLRANTTNSNSRKNAPRKAKLQAEQLLQLKKFVSTDESD